MCGVPDYPKRRSEETSEENHSLDAETNQPLLKKKTTMMVNGKEVKKKSKKKKKNNIDADKFKAEPLARLGFGIVAYTDILWVLIVIFSLFSVMLAPTILAFKGGEGYKNVDPLLI